MPMPPQKSSADLSIHNDLADLVVVTGALDQLGEKIGFSAKALMQLQVALDEILSNVVKYSWPDGGSHNFRVRIEASELAIEIVITDDGIAFDPRAQPPSSVYRKWGPAGGRRPRPGGKGIHMVRQLVDGFDYQRIEELNCVTLTKQNVLAKTSP